MADLFNTGIRPSIDAYLKAESEKIRDYGSYWSASSAGYCMRLNIMRRLGVPKVPELEDSSAQTRIFESGKIFHEWMQRITKNAGLSIASEVELQDEELMIRGHFDDLVLTNETGTIRTDENLPAFVDFEGGLIKPKQHLILYDYKTAHSASFNFSKNRPMGHYHSMQLATYMYMIRKIPPTLNEAQDAVDVAITKLDEARILSISKDDLRMEEKQLLWSPELEKKVYEYWNTLNGYWKSKTMPRCTCLEYDGGFLGKRSAKGKIYNDFYYQDEPCSLEWYKLWKEKQGAALQA